MTLILLAKIIEEIANFSFVDKKINDAPLRILKGQTGENSFRCKTLILRKDVYD